MQVMDYCGIEQGETETHNTRGNNAKDFVKLYTYIKIVYKKVHDYQIVKYNLMSEFKNNGHYYCVYCN